MFLLVDLRPITDYYNAPIVLGIYSSFENALVPWTLENYKLNKLNEEGGNLRFEDNVFEKNRIAIIKHEMDKNLDLFYYYDEDQGIYHWFENRVEKC